MAPPILLVDEQVRFFVANGYLVIQPTVPGGTHETINDKFNWLAQHETNPGNNILPRVPELNLVIESPEVRGAMLSLLGKNYMLHPHRYWHDLPPKPQHCDDQEQVWEQVLAGSHQDTYTPAVQPRRHHLRYARFMYYSHAVEEVNGPTHVIPGSQFHAMLVDEDRQRQVPVTGRAGTVFLSHFDLGHAAGVNRSEQVRNMIKFIFLRTEDPDPPTWNCRSTQWQKPRQLTAPHDLDAAWQHHWDWLCGRRSRPETAPDQCPEDAMAVLDSSEDLRQRLEALNTLARIGPDATPAIPALSALLNTAPQAERTAAIYALAAIGHEAVASLIAVLVAAGERESQHDVPPSFNDHAVAMDDAAHAMAAMGDPAIAPLVALLESPHEWTVLNAIFALGEIGGPARTAVPRLAALLDDPSYRVIQFAMTSLGNVGDSSAQAALCAFMDRDREEWGRKVGKNHWPLRHLLHANAAMALAMLGGQAADSQDQIIRHLGHPFGHVGIFLTEALRRIGSPPAIDAVVKDLHFRRWDAALHKDQRY